MLSVATLHATMTDTVVENQAPTPEEILEDGEIDEDEEEEEVVTEETVIAEENAVQNNAGSANVENHRSDNITTNEHNDNDEDNDSAEDEKKRSHKKHQRKRKKELRASEKKERRRKRKMHAHEDNTEAAHVHGGSTSPHSKKRKKRKKHSRDHKDRDSTSPESNASDDQFCSAYYGTGNGYTDEYGNQGSMYSSSKLTGGYNVNNSSSAYYSTTADQGDYNDPSESGSDFEAQLAEYQNYKTHGAVESENHSKESGNYEDKRWKKDSSRKTKMSSVEREISRQNRTGEMYEEFMEYDENPRRPCKFFAEGKCLKGNECSFSHDQTRQRTRMKKREMCKYYLAGHCHHGKQCSYMHGEYPCKYFHTGATCYAGDNCRFSHDPATEETMEIIENFKDVLSNVDDSWEMAELAKVGIEVRAKPPPGMGLLPTPDMPPLTSGDQKPATGGRSIPSIFDISVTPTADFQKRIEENSVASISMTDELEGIPDVGINEPRYHSRYEISTETVQHLTLNKGPGLLPTPSIPPNPNLVAAQSKVQPLQDSDSFYDNFYEGEDNDKTHTEEQSKVGKSDDVFVRIDNSTTDDEHTEVENAVKVPDFLPATQKALFMRIHGKRTSSESDKGSSKDNLKNKDPDAWTYSSDEEEKDPARDPGIIKMDVGIPTSSSESTSQTSSAAVESLLKMITSKQGGNSTNVDTNLLSKVASVINMPTTTNASTEHYNPASSVATYNPAHSKASTTPNTGSTGMHQSHHRERKSSGSSSASPGHSSKHHRPHAIRRRLSTQELTKDTVIIPLVTKQSANQTTMHTAHPDPRLTLSRLIGVKVPHFSANLPRFSKDLILPGSGKIIGLKITLSSEDSKTTKRDPRLGRHKDPRLHRANDPRLKSRTIAKAAAGATTTEPKSSIPSKPSALLTKSSSAIPSLPELDLNMAHVNHLASKEIADGTTAASYSLPNLKLPKLVKAPAASPSHDSIPSSSLVRETSAPPPTIAPYDPRYMSSGPAKSSGSDLAMNTAPYDPRLLSSHSSVPAGTELKKRTIQLPKLTPAPTYKPTENSSDITKNRPVGDQGDF